MLICIISRSDVENAEKLLSDYLFGVFVENDQDKTTGYHRHIFRPPISLNMRSKRMNIFFSKNTLHHMVSNFSYFKKTSQFKKLEKFSKKYHN